MTRPLDRILDLLERVKFSGGSYTARCPAHDDRNPSLSISEGEDANVLLRCHAGCDTENVLKALGLTWNDLYSSNGKPTTSKRTAKAEKPSKNWQELHQTFRGQITKDQVEQLAKQLGVSEASVHVLEIGWATQEQLSKLNEKASSGAFTIPERDGSGNIIGFCLRTETGSKFAIQGCQRGIYGRVGNLGNVESETVYSPEGASDTLALLSLGICSIGRPSASSGVDHLKQITKGTHIVIVGDNDNGAGAKGAHDAAKALANYSDSPYLGRWLQMVRVQGRSRVAKCPSH